MRRRTCPTSRRRCGSTPQELAKVPEIHLAPGMPAEVFIVTGERTALDYLIQPLRDSFHRAFREQ